ncbi:MAG: ribosome silencing factor [Acidobacteria bacterium]|nr:ribosome silencing factor [Acidobacteriota bacterium]
MTYTETKTESEVTISRTGFDNVKVAVAAAEDKKAIDLVVLKLVEITSFADYFVICSGTSTRQVQAIADEIEDRLKQVKVRPLNIEGYNNAEWVLMDYGSMIVHVFSENSRRFYDLERLWRDAEKLDLTSLQG